MMRCQCSICQELFENNDDHVISALDCGHTFHNACINQWLENGRTCPSCRNQINRKRIIQRLYFDQPEDLDEEIDSNKLQNEIDKLKLEIRNKEKERKNAVSNKAEYESQISNLEKTRKKLEQKVREEQNINSGHMKTLKYFESQQASLELEKQECRKIKQKLVTLQSLETLLNGCESDAAHIITSTGEGSSAVQNLSRQVAFMKREYEKQKLERRQMKEQFEKVRLQLEKVQLSESQKNKKVSELTQKCQVLQDLLERSEGDLKLAEKEVGMLKRKNSKLKQVIQSPSAGAGSSSFTQIMNESKDLLKLNAHLCSTPKLGKGDNDVETVDLDITPDLFISPTQLSSQAKSVSPVSQVISNQSKSETINSQIGRKSVKRACENEDPLVPDASSTKFLKITSAAEKSKSQSMKRFKSDSSVSDTTSIKGIASMNIFKKRGLGESNRGNSVVQKGYDGLGGHTTHINSKGNPFKKPVVKKTINKYAKTPSLPKLDGFITLD